jgi:hypothetical protein
MPHYLPWMSEKLNREESRILVMRTLMAIEKSTEVPPLVGENDHWGCLGREGASPHQARICALTRHRHVARQLESPWDKYKALNGIRE